MNRIALATVILCSFIRAINAQAPGVPVYDETRLKRADAAAITAPAS